MALKRFLLILLLVGAAVAFLAWPRLNDVQTGRTPEYPDLQDRAYTATEQRVGEAVKTTLGRLPGWTLVGAGRGPGGMSVQAVHATLPGFKDDVTIRIRREAGKTRVSVRSRSRVGKLDFGQNARNIREFLGALDHDLS